MGRASECRDSLVMFSPIPRRPLDLACTSRVCSAKRHRPYRMLPGGFCDCRPGAAPIPLGRGRRGRSGRPNFVAQFTLPLW